MGNLLKSNLIKLKIENKKLCCRIRVCLSNSCEVLLDNIAGILYNQPAIIILEKDNNISDMVFVEFTKKVRLLANEFDSALIILNRADIAYITEADGLFLNYDGISVHDAISIVGENSIIGVENSSLSGDAHIDFVVIGNMLVTEHKKLNITEIT